MLRRLLSVLFILLPAVAAPDARAQARISPDLPLEELDGSASSLGVYLRQGPVYVTFWATWCEPCKQELRALKGIAAAHADKAFTILAVNQDAPKTMAKVKAYVKSQNYPFPVIRDPNAQVLQAFNGQTLPFSVLLDAKGNVLKTRTGYLPGDEKDIEQDILRAVR